MQIIWKFSTEDIEAVQSIVRQHDDHPMVIHRRRHNLANKKPAIRRDRLWKAIVAALLTTQQRSGPTSPVARFIATSPFPLAYAVSCRQKERKREHFFSEVLSSFGGIRRYRKIAAELDSNLRVLEGDTWQELRDRLDQLRRDPVRLTEVTVADYINDRLKGFGPKQARNLLQALGLTAYEIPIDSRITGWLNQNGFPVHLSSGGLADRDYYKFVMDGVVELCKASNVYPCIFDAAVFSSYDNEGWTPENVGW